MNEDKALAPRNDARLRRIDALRGIAALLVVWLHVSESYVQLGGIGGRWVYDVASSVDVGRIGVVAFFLISGFVIPFSIRRDQPAAVATFAIKRILRIYPAYWLSIPFGALTTYWLWGRDFGVRDFLLNLTLMQDLFGAQPAEGLYWTLLFELVFYALCIALLLTRSLFDMRRIWLLAVAFSAVFSLAMLMHQAGMPIISTSSAFWFLNLAMMLCGTLYRSCVFDTNVPVARGLKIGVYCLLSYHLLIVPLGAIWLIGFSHNVTISYALGLLLFMMLTSVIPVATRLTDTLGRISYSIYLFHPVVFQLLLWWLLHQPADSWLRSRHLALYVLVNMLLSILVAGVVYRWIERPGIGLGRRLTNAWRA